MGRVNLPRDKKNKINIWNKRVLPSYFSDGEKQSQVLQVSEIFGQNNFDPVSWLHLDVNLDKERDSEIKITLDNWMWCRSAALK